MTSDTRLPTTTTTRTLTTAALWSVVLVLLLIPACTGLALLQTGAFEWHNLVAGVGLTGLLLASSCLVPVARRSWVVTVAAILIILFFLRSLFAGLVWFSGRDFDADFFVHLNRESAAVALQQYPGLFVLFGLGALILAAGLVWSSRRLWFPRSRAAGGIALASLALLAAGYAGTPEWHLVEASRAWLAPKQIELPNGRMAVWEKSPLINVDLVSKQRLKAEAPTPAKNLILLYIESGGLGFIESDRHPGLMPNMERLVHEHGYLPWIWASSYVTIEGLANTQCGTLLPFEQGSDSMAGFDNMVDEMPCLGDVLHAAGYQQSYLGGSDKSFAGKGRFLDKHGFDKVMGMGDWQELGLNQRPDTWGLSDVDLFEQSLDELERLKASGKPYNLTMLTIGTHLPGFPYEECKPWGDGEERFLNAVSCSDQLIGHWIEQLQAGGWLDDNTILAITGDHNFFPNALMKRLFGRQAVEHRVVPLVILGHDLPKPVQSEGAGFDLAPTLIDLLGIDTNARFAMGRSLLRDERPIRYFASRYIDIYNGKPWHFNDPFDCNAGNTKRIPGLQPLSRCERDELSTLLRMQMRAYSAAPVQMRCQSTRPIRIAVPEDPEQNLDFQVSGQQQSGRFTWQERHVEGNKPGLYLAALDGSGTLVWRKYTPPEELAQTLADPPEREGAMLAAIAWRPDPDADAVTTLPAWLTAAGLDGERGAWLLRIGTDGRLELAAKSNAEGTLTIDSRECAALINTDD